MYTEVTFYGFFSNLASIAGCGCEFHVGIMRGNFRPYKFWPHLDFLLEKQIIIVLRSFTIKHTKAHGKKM